MKRHSNNTWDIYGSELSPFTLKLIALFDHHGLPYRFVPAETGAAHSIRILLRRIKLIKGRLPLTWPKMTKEDEFPLVPFLFGPQGENLYDSSAVAQWLDLHLALPDRKTMPADPAIAFVTRLIDDYADEFGLYLVHHQRWKVSAIGNNAGERLSREFRKLLGPLQGYMASHFSSRQTRRLPYLFSVAPEGFHIEGLNNRRQPPSRAEFPATHALLEESFTRLILAMEKILAAQPFILGQRFSLADTAIYGQLSMNMDDPETARHIQKTTPLLYSWLEKIRNHDIPKGSDTNWELNDCLMDLLHEICQTHIPLMQQNYAAYRQWVSQGEIRFNERAFNQHRALYEGELVGQKFRHVAKSFQTCVWRACHDNWRSLDKTAREKVERLLPQSHGLDAREAQVKLVEKSEA